MGRREVDELEVIDLTAEAGAPSGDAESAGRPPFRWRRPAVVVPVVVLAVAAAVVGPVRAIANTRALERMEHVLVVAIALEDEADDRSAGLVRTNPTLGDRVFLDALRTLTRAQTSRLRELRSDLPRALLLNDRLRAARSELDTYLDLRIRELGALVRDGPSSIRTLSTSSGTMAHRLRADRALADERKRHGGERDEARLGDVELPSLEEERAALRRPTDDGAGLSLVAATDDGPMLLDLDTGRETGAGTWSGESAITVSGETLVWLSDARWFEPSGQEVPRRVAMLRGDPNDLVNAMTANLASIRELDAPFARIQRVIKVAPSRRPGAVWLQELGTDGRMVVREIDAAGATVLGPVPLPAGTTLFGAAEPGLVLDGDDLVVWRPTDGRVLRQIANAHAVSLGGDTLLWGRGGEDESGRFVTSLTSGVDRQLETERFGRVWRPGSVSPDGTRIVVSSDLGWRVHEVVSGTTHDIRGEARGLPAWSPDGQHVFLPTATRGYRRGAVVGSVETLLRWDVASRQAVGIRLRNSQWYWGFAVVETP